jgi:hypothetical protein
MRHIFAVESATVSLDFLPDGSEGAAAPEICRLYVIIGVCVKAFVRWYKLVELMDEKEDWIQLSRVGHESMKCRVGFVLSET